MDQRQSTPGQPPANSSAPPTNKDVLDAPLSLLGFEFDEITPQMVSGHLPITEKCCQPFKVLHGGVSALIAESLASMGAHIASGFGRIAGISLSINHVKTAQLGDILLAQAKPISLGRTVQVWEVWLWKTTPSNPESKTTISSSRVTLLCNVHADPKHTKDASDKLRKYAKL